MDIRLSPANRVLACFRDLADSEDSARPFVCKGPALFGGAFTSASQYHRAICEYVFGQIAQRAATDGTLAALVSEHLPLWDAHFRDVIVPAVPRALRSGRLHADCRATGFIRAWVGLTHLKPSNFTKERLGVVVEGLRNFGESGAVFDNRAEALFGFALAFPDEIG
jgi:hypothetical protein